MRGRNEGWKNNCKRSKKKAEEDEEQWEKGKEKGSKLNYPMFVFFSPSSCLLSSTINPRLLG